MPKFKKKKEKEVKSKKVKKQTQVTKVRKPIEAIKTKKVGLKKKTSVKKIAFKKNELKILKKKEIPAFVEIRKKEKIEKQVLVKERIRKEILPAQKVIEPPKVEREIKEEIKIAQPQKVSPTVIEERKEEQKVALEEKREIPVIKKQLKPLEIEIPITVKDLAVRIKEKSAVLIKYLIERQKMFVTINQVLENEEIIRNTLEDFGYEYKKNMTDEELLLESHLPEEKEFLLRPPVITLMGHVDHGKTSLLDAIRRSKIAEKEHGGITQHIGAYEVTTDKGEITFLDTPGHEAFTAMRARGANITDIVVLVVAADDGVMPQTVEAIDHSKAAKVPIIVAINKIDKPHIDIDRVKKQLTEYGLTPEEWSGKTIMVGVSAKTGQGIDQLLEMILLEAEMLELKSVYDKLAQGVVIEARFSKDQGPIVTVLVQSGTLKTGDNIICGVHYGKIRAMINDLGQRIDKVTPGMPAEILGLSGLPEAGEKFYVLDDEKKIRNIIAERQMKERQKRLVSEPRHISLDDLYSKIQKGEVKELNLVLKADVQGSLEAVKESLGKLISKEVSLNILHSGVGPINSSDVILAEASNAIIIGFHVDADNIAQELANNKKVDIRTYRIIYELINEIKAALEGLLEPKIKKIFIGRAIVQKVFNLSKAGVVAGCLVQKGEVLRQAIVTLTRDGQILFEGNISSLKRFKDDVRDVQEGFECGISLSGFSDFKEGDIIDAYTIKKIARTL